MNSDTVFALLYISVFVGGFIMLLLVGDGLFNLAYRFIPAFRRRMDRFYKTLPQWDENRR